MHGKGGLPCRPSVAFIAQVLFAAFTFQVSELINLFQIRDLNAAKQEQDIRFHAGFVGEHFSSHDILSLVGVVFSSKSEQALLSFSSPKFRMSYLDRLFRSDI